ncbi:MAG: hypothetical protein L3J32_09700 [Rhizobiaceae bacterium]|nr:hypothetical protein [Rhizobiaceae bacterium]
MPKIISKSPVLCTLVIFTAMTMAVTATSFGQENTQSSETAPVSPGQRFQIEREGNGFVRLDKKTGETSFCQTVNDVLVCRLAVEERDTLHREISDLQNKLTAEKEKLAALDETGSSQQSQVRPKDGVPDTSKREGAGSERDEFEQEMDRALDITRRTMRKLFSAVKELRKEFGDDLFE